MQAAAEGLSVYTADLQIFQNDSMDNPPPAPREPPLHKGAFLPLPCGMPLGSFHEPLHKGDLFVFAPRDAPLHKRALGILK